MTAAVLRSELDALVDGHFDAEVRGDVGALLATFTDDVEHDVVGNERVSHGRQAAAAFYEHLLADLRLDEIRPVHRYYGDDFVVDESVVHAHAIGHPFGIDGRNRALQFRLLHVFEFRDGLISRENAWLDVGAIMSQLA
jgi:steroid delta-isomerase-like uncharacterized protein